MRSSLRAPATAFALGAALLLAACDGDPVFDADRRAGALDLTRVVAIGDGYMAGAADDALYASAQRHSPLALFLLRSTRAESVAQPLLADPGYSLLDQEVGRLAFVSRLPLVIRRLPRGGPLVEPAPPHPYDNLAVPGALVAEALTSESEATSLLGNPFYDLVLRDRGPAAAQVAEAGASLVLMWYGTGDVLPWVANGGDPDLAPGLPTPGGTFDLFYERLLDRVMETTDQVVLFTVPDVTALPVVNAIPPLVVNPQTGEPLIVTELVPEVDPETGDTVLVSMEVVVPLIGPDGELTEDDFVTLEAASLVADGVGVPPGVLNGTGEPLPDRAVLDPGERAVARSVIAEYNETIRRLAAERDLALVDVHALVETMGGGGVTSDGLRLTTEWLFGHAFGLDGAHFTPRGNGLVANLLIDALNERYGARLPRVRTADLPSIPLLRLE